ncbi:MAG: hypothetical protein Kow00105_07070 [Phycisphaeraceae bacterium]
MNQIIRRSATSQMIGEVVFIKHVDYTGFNARITGPRSGKKFYRRANQATDMVTRVKKTGP